MSSSMNVTILRRRIIVNSSPSDAYARNVQNPSHKSTKSSVKSPTRQEPSIEKTSGELQEDPGESQTTNSTDNAEVLSGFCCIQDDFIHGYYIEFLIQLYELKENIFFISTKYIWCTKIHFYWSGCVAFGTCRWLLECRFKQKLIRFVDRFTKLTLLSENISVDIRCQIRSRMIRSTN